MDIGLLAAIAGVIAVGALSALVRAWSILSRLYSLEDRLSIVEGTLTREVKVRAVNGRWSKRDAEDAILQATLQLPPVAPAPKLPWWTAAQKHPRSVSHP